MAGFAFPGLDTDMPDAKASVPAKYDPNRDANGHFVKGHQLAAGRGSEAAKKFNALRSAWYDCVTPEDVAELTAELKHFALTCQLPEVKLKAMIYLLDRCLGKPEATVNVDVTHQRSAPPINIPAEDVRVLEKYVEVINIQPNKPQDAQ